MSSLNAAAAYSAHMKDMTHLVIGERGFKRPSPRTRAPHKPSRHALPLRPGSSYFLVMNPVERQPARDILSSRSGKRLEFLTYFLKVVTPSTIPFRILRVFRGNEEDGQERLYVEAIMPSGDATLLSVEGIGNQLTSDDGIHKVVGLIADVTVYDKLLNIQSGILGTCCLFT